MTILTKQIIIVLLSAAFIVSLIFVQWMEVARKREESGARVRHVSIPVSSSSCIACQEIVARNHRPLEREHARHQGNV